MADSDVAGNTSWDFRSAVAADEVVLGPDGEAVDLRTDVAHVARIYDYWLGGKTNYPADREVAEKVLVAMPSTTQSVRANRSFLRRAVHLLASEHGIRQFLDIGTGVPAADNTHEVAQRAAPDARVLYVDNDPIVLAHAQALLTSTPEGATTYLHGDVRDPADILTKAAGVLDLSQPVALMLVAIMHCVSDEEDPYAVVRTLSEGLPAGSYLVLSHPGIASAAAATSTPSADALAAAALLRSASAGATITFRRQEQVTELFDGWDLLEPGVVLATKWRADEPEQTIVWAGVGHKPA
ncbi:SAM-dependent methyltransferase [Frankia sp. CNm7]|uniref:SAM-dependent methyltransferase n=1 Tax=Frankia nepalensis TaxID=1836974 RepID=A0A937R9N4_9ACTN|nr:SAM-dependent methyltransferase [Frankia nepalensis]MBL7502389.1 SAM-dependent methyltransferase [Frankia nepalensis]MBL7516216.1 SAM-dependent methyltransferase [Frankia nepalensis]MBL7518508.1 SAM-dependent methyltransferase [Frankia nepalensis]MBL7625692.1 SAM-dependent methyltransferase [Frankia nepalensis]